MALKAVIKGSRLAGAAIPYPPATLAKDSFILFVASDKMSVRGAGYTDVAPLTNVVQKGFIGLSFKRIDFASEIAGGIKFLGEANNYNFEYVLFHFDRLNINGVLPDRTGSRYFDFSDLNQNWPSTVAYNSSSIVGGFDAVVYGFIGSQQLATGTIAVSTWPTIIPTANRGSLVGNGWAAGYGINPAAGTAVAAGTIGFSSPLVGASLQRIGVRWEPDYAGGEPDSKLAVNIGDPVFRKVKRLWVRKAGAWSAVKTAWIKKSGIWQPFYDTTQMNPIKVSVAGSKAFPTQVSTASLTVDLPAPDNSTNKRYLVATLAAVQNSSWDFASLRWYLDNVELTVSAQKWVRSNSGVSVAVCYWAIPSAAKLTGEIKWTNVTCYSSLMSAAVIETVRGLSAPIQATGTLTGTNVDSALLGDWGAASVGKGPAVMVGAHSGGKIFTGVAPTMIEIAKQMPIAGAQYPLFGAMWSTDDNAVNDSRWPGASYQASTTGRAALIPILFTLL